MKTQGFVYVVLTTIEFTEQELVYLMQASRKHYDHACRILSNEVGFRLYDDTGCLTAAQNRLQSGFWPSSFTFRQIDLFLKLCEYGGSKRPEGLVESLKEAAKANDARACELAVIKEDTPALST